MFGFGPYLPEDLLQSLLEKDMTLTTEAEKFAGWIKTLELKFFKGKLHQKVVSPNPGETPDHVWVPIAAHDVEAPAAGEPIAAAPPADKAKQVTA